MVSNGLRHGAARLAIGALGLAVVIVPASRLYAGQTQNATAPASTAAAPSAATIAKGRDLFNNWGCGGCHALTDANANAHIGPSFDGDTNLTKDFVVNRVTNGQGAMPAFGGQLSDQEIADLAYYISKVQKKKE